MERSPLLAPLLFLAALAFPPGASAAATPEPCPNLAVRARQLNASRLLDCRAYVQVSPVDKNDQDAEGNAGNVSASPDGDRVRYFSKAPFPGAESSLLDTFYVSSRPEAQPACVGVRLCDGSEAAGRSGPGEWGTLGLPPVPVEGGFSGDLSQVLVETGGVPGLPEEPPGFYLWEPATGVYRLVVPAPVELQISVAGFSADGRQLVFESANPLGLASARAGAVNTYEFDAEKPVGAQLSLVGLVPPSGDPACGGTSGVSCETPVGSVAGAGAGAHIRNKEGLNESAEPTYTQSAVSANGSVVVFTAANGEYEGRDGHEGLLYARIGGEETLAVSAGVAHFRAATPDGEYVFYTEAGGLWRFDTQSKQRVEIAPATAGVLGTLGVSEEGTSVFFAAKGVLAHNTRVTRVSGKGTLTEHSSEVGALATVDSGSFFAAGQAIEGEGIEAGTTITGVTASALTLSKPATDSATGVELTALAEEAAGEGSPNLYEWSQDGKEPFTFIAGLSSGGGKGSDGKDWEDTTEAIGRGQRSRTSRLTPDGQTLLFSSINALTGYDNGGYQEFFRFRLPAHEGEAPSLMCVSCGSPGSEAHFESLTTGATGFLTPLRETALTRNLSEDGERVFFNTQNPLPPLEQNDGYEHTYEWEANGEGSCHSEAQNGGCMSLISAGATGTEEVFADASANGDDVFFFTGEPLGENDVDQNVDVYDAQVDGAIEKPRNACNPEAERCSEPPCFSNPECDKAPNSEPPAETLPSTAAFTGPGNLVSPPTETLKTTTKKTLTNAQKLTAALKKCKKDKSKRRRADCERTARKRYAPPAKKAKAKR